AHQYTNKGLSLGARNDQSNLPSLRKIELHLSILGNRHSQGPGCKSFHKTSVQRWTEHSPGVDYG
ncbi:MAG: hypothetical protein ABW043_11135, partial [Devosia sp.]|uniref:hypothetical protein n=1 Tax=Devosia sp. TaxID=1871048 RepID=UPI0033992DD1